MPTEPEEDENLIPSKRFIGVWWDPDNDFWVVRVETDEETVDCGEFLDEVEAAHKYDECIADLSTGRLPELNFPNES